jgi:Flp pilus assembly protein TadB
MKRDDRRTKSRPTRSDGRSGTILALVAGMAVAGLPHAAAAYVGPGAGLTMLGALWAVIAAVLFALAGLVIWPIRAMRRRRQQLASAKAATAPGDGDAGGA